MTRAPTTVGDQSFASTAGSETLWSSHCRQRHVLSAGSCLLDSYDFVPDGITVFNGVTEAALPMLQRLLHTISCDHCRIPQRHLTSGTFQDLPERVGEPKPTTHWTLKFTSKLWFRLHVFRT